jgi:hypothetical protein
MFAHGFQMNRRAAALLFSKKAGNLFSYRSFDGRRMRGRPDFFV